MPQITHEEGLGGGGQRYQVLWPLDNGELPLQVVSNSWDHHFNAEYEARHSSVLRLPGNVCSVRWARREETSPLTPQTLPPLETQSNAVVNMQLRQR